MDKARRPVIAQGFYPFALAVGVTATPLNQSFQQSSLDGLFESFLISVPGAAANGVLLGDAGVSAAAHNGLEILPGAPIMLSIHNERPLYEVQSPLIQGLACGVPEAIPFVAWNVSNIYLVATAPVTIGVILFKAAFI